MATKAPSNQELKHREIVSSFLFDLSDENRPLVALFKRSDKVRTYQGKFAPISGSVERSDQNLLKAALREIGEETSLSLEHDVSLHLRGPSFFIADHEIGRSWTVHPFSFTLVANAKTRIKIDWEHSRYQWFAPEQILGGDLEDDTVPRLQESLRRCWLGPPSTFSDAKPILDEKAILRQSLKDIANDHQSGAKELASKALEFLKQIVECHGKDNEQSTESTWQWTLFTTWMLIYNGRPAMNAALSTALLSCLKSITQRTSPQKIVAQIEEYIQYRLSVVDAIGEQFFLYLQNTSLQQDSAQDAPTTINILTVSSSSTFIKAILHVLKELDKNCKVKLLILESRPAFEGVTMADRIHSVVASSESGDEYGRERLEIVLVPDSSIAHLISDINQGPAVVVLGADRISHNGDVSNKTGSLPLVLTAKDVARRKNLDFQVIVLSDREKIAKHVAGQEEAEDEMNPAAEIAEVWKDLDIEAASLLEYNSMRVINKYFECVPAEHVDVYLSEKGPMSRTEIQARSEFITKLEDEIFGKLGQLN